MGKKYKQISYKDGEKKPMETEKNEKYFGPKLLENTYQIDYCRISGDFLATFSIICR